MKYEYEPITEFFKPTTWSEDVSTAQIGYCFIACFSLGELDLLRDAQWYRFRKLMGQKNGPFGLVSKNWESFKRSISGMSYPSLSAPIFTRYRSLAEFQLELTSQCASGESIKVVYLGRHGHGQCFLFIGSSSHQPGVRPAHRITSPYIMNPEMEWFQADDEGEHNIIHEQYRNLPWAQVSPVSYIE
jgi:hypothetical protein